MPVLKSVYTLRDSLTDVKLILRIRHRLSKLHLNVDALLVWVESGITMGVVNA